MPTSEEKFQKFPVEICKYLILECSSGYIFMDRRSNRLQDFVAKQ